MKRFLFVCAASALTAVGAFAQAPSISAGGVVPAATYAPSGLVNSGIAQGSFFSIFGTNLATTTAYPPTALYINSLAGTSVNITVGSTTTQALLYFVSPNQINGVVPSTVSTGTASFTVTTAGGTSATQTVPVVASNFGMLTRDGGGTGPALVQAFPAYTLNALNASAKANDILILYGTGLGPSAAGDQVADTGGTTGLQVDFRSNLDFHFYIGGVDATSNVSYAGLSPYAGLDQINFTIPSTAPTGCYVPLAVRIGSIVSNFGTISIASDNGTCSDPYGLTSSQITSATTGKLDVASLLLTRIALQATVSGLSVKITEDTADGRFYQFDPSNYYYSPLNGPDFIGLSSFGSCAVTSCANTSTCIPTAQAAILPKLDAGSALTVAGNGHTASVAKNTAAGPNQNLYAANLGSSPIALTGFPLVSFLDPGTYTYTGPGGADINAFTANITVPSPVTATFSPTVDGTHALNRSSDLTATWSPSGSGFMLLAITSATTNTGITGQTNSATITCLPPMSAGTFTIPSWLLQALPTSTNVTFSGLTVTGGAVLTGNLNLSGTFTSNAGVSLANALVLSGANITVQ